MDASSKSEGQSNSFMSKVGQLWNNAKWWQKMSFILIVIPLLGHLLPEKEKRNASPSVYVAAAPAAPQITVQTMKGMVGRTKDDILSTFGTPSGKGDLPFGNMAFWYNDMAYDSDVGKKVTCNFIFNQALVVERVQCH